MNLRIAPFTALWPHTYPPDPLPSPLRSKGRGKPVLDRPSRWRAIGHSRLTSHRALPLSALARTRGGAPTQWSSALGHFSAARTGDSALIRRLDAISQRPQGLQAGLAWIRDGAPTQWLDALGHLSAAWIGEGAPTRQRGTGPRSTAAWAGPGARREGAPTRRQVRTRSAPRLAPNGGEMGGARGAEWGKQGPGGPTPWPEAGPSRAASPRDRGVRGAEWGKRGEWGERGQASAELAIILPIIIIFILGIIAAAQLAYTHLALITIANDCATSGAQVTSANSAWAGSQGMDAAQDSQGTFNIESPLKSAVTGAGAAASVMCGASLVVWGPPTSYLVRYDFNMPLQPYKSNWEEAP